MKKLLGGRIRAAKGENIFALAEQVRRDPEAARMLAEARDLAFRALKKISAPKPVKPEPPRPEVSLNLIAAAVCDGMDLTIAQLIEPLRTPSRHAARCKFAKAADAAGYDVYEIAGYLQRERTTVLHMFKLGGASI